MAKFINKFLDSMKLNDEDFEEEEDFDLDEEFEEEERPRFARKKKPINEMPENDIPATPSQDRGRTVKKPVGTVVPMRSRNNMEVCMVKPTSMDDAREICTILLSGRSVVINMEGVEIELAQRIVDFTSGACFSMNGNLQNISKFIFIATPSSVELSGDFHVQQEGAQKVDRKGYSENLF